MLTYVQLLHILVLAHIWLTMRTKEKENDDDTMKKKLPVCQVFWIPHWDLQPKDGALRKSSSTQNGPKSCIFSEHGIPKNHALIITSRMRIPTKTYPRLLLLFWLYTIQLFPHRTLGSIQTLFWSHWNCWKFKINCFYKSERAKWKYTSTVGDLLKENWPQ